MITVSTTINSTIEHVWDCFSNPKHIVNWNFAADSWHCPKAESDFKINGNFNYSMAAKDESFSFDFEGTFTKIENLSKIEYSIIDGRKVIITFEQKENEVLVTETFEPEKENSLELQQNGWQAILDNFKKYVETN